MLAVAGFALLIMSTPFLWVGNLTIRRRLFGGKQPRTSIPKALVLLALGIVLMGAGGACLAAAR
jgi:hypothetical protein